MATSFNTQVERGKYRLQFSTDNKKHYQFVQSAARRCVDGKAINMIAIVDTGTWTPIECRDWRYGVWTEYLCGCCGKVSDEATPHCPYCGAKMTGGLDNER